PPPHTRPTQSPRTQDAPPKRAAVSKREQTVPSMPMNGFTDVLPEGRREAVTSLPGVPVTSPDGKREQTANGRARGQACLPDARSRPSANGANGQQQRQTPQQPQRSRQPSGPSGQAQRKPPRR